MQKPTQRSQIRINIGLNDQNVPISIDWDADSQPGKTHACKAMLLSLFERETKDTMKIDLWTEDMQIAEMDRFFFQTLRALADTYFKATKNRELATDLQRFVQYFGEKTEILKAER
jgi:gliding motility-associated protein GldC